MDPASRDFARELFVQATALMEDAVLAAVDGQSPALDDAGCRDAAGQLHRTAAQLTTIARTLDTVVAANGGPPDDADHEP